MDMLLKDEIKSNINTIWCPDGHLSTTQRDYLIEMLYELNPRNCLEIGFAGGRHTSTLLHSCTPEKVISIDINFDYAYGRTYVNTFKQKFINIEFYENNSNEFITDDFMKKKFPSGLDYVFVDGGHSFHECLSDMQNCWDALNDKGVMIVDDYNSGPPHGVFIRDVNMAVEFFMKYTTLDLEVITLSDGKGMAKLMKKPIND